MMIQLIINSKSTREIRFDEINSVAFSISEDMAWDHRLRVYNIPNIITHKIVIRIQMS